MPAPVVGIVSAHYYARHLRTNLPILSALARDSKAVEWIPVGNHDDLDLRLAADQAPPWTTTSPIRHDNRGREFGAYQKGLEALLRSTDPDWVVFANDTLGVHAPFVALHRRNLLRFLERLSDVDAPIAIGEEERWHRSFPIEGRRTHRWLTTHLFALNRRALVALDHRLWWPQIDRLVVGGADRARFFDRDCDPVLVEHLEAWLFGGNGTTRWYGAAALTPQNEAAMAAKARCILQEKYLSALLESAGAWFADVKSAGTLSDRLLRRLQEAVFQARSRAPS